MRRSGDIPWGQWRLGLFLFVGIAIFLWASIRGGAAFLEDRDELRARFANVDGLTQGSPVWFRGLEVGNVSGIEINTDEDSSYVEVSLSVQSEIVEALHGDAWAQINAINFFGEKFVNLRSGSVGAGSFDPSTLLPTREPSDFDRMLRRGEATLARVDSMSANLNALLARVERGEGSVGRVFADDELYLQVRRLVQDTDRLARSLHENQARTSAALTSTAVQLDTLLARTNRGHGTLGLLARDPELYRAMAGAARSADSTLTPIAAGEGTLGKLAREEKLHEEMTETLERLNVLLTDIQRNPGKYFKFSVF